MKSNSTTFYDISGAILSLFFVLLVSCSDTPKTRVEVDNGVRNLIINDTMRVYPNDHRFDEIGAVIYVFQVNRNGWVSLDSARAERFRTRNGMVFYFLDRHELRCSGDTIERFLFIY